MTGHRGATACALVLCVLLAASPAAATGDGGHGRDPRRSDDWDDRVRSIVEEVEALRGLDFERSVRVSFLGDRRFEREFESDPGELARTERRELEDSTAALRALGLFEGDADELFESVAEVDAEGTLAFYDSEEERIVIRGRSLDVETEVTVAHELVHALQDQHFNLDRLVDRTADSTEEFALTALIEGDAVRIEQDYVSGLSSAQQDEYFAANAETASEVEAGFSDAVPEIIPATFAIPYHFGPYMVLNLVDEGGNERVDAAFRAPPVTDEHFLEPDTYVEEDDPDDVPRIRLDPGERKIGRAEPFGAVTLYLMLVSRIDTGTALDAVDGWGGDQVVQFERDDQTCVRAHFVGETREDTDQIAAALEQWVATLPPDTATTVRAEVVTFTSCDTRTGFPPAPNSVGDAEFLLYARADLSYFLARPPERVEPEVARCAATRVVLDPANEELLEATEFTEEQANTLGERIGVAVAECDRGDPLTTGTVASTLGY